MKEQRKVAKVHTNVTYRRVMTERVVKNLHRTHTDPEHTAGFVSAPCVCEICAAHSFGGPYYIKKEMLLAFL
jgi:hypothetical protein